MGILHFKKSRLKLLGLADAGTLESVVSREWVTQGLVIPRNLKDSVLKLLDAGLGGECCVVWKDYVGGEACFRPLESNVTPSFLMNHPDVKVRIRFTDCSGAEQGFLEPELFYCFIPDWEERILKTCK